LLCKLLIFLNLFESFAVVGEGLKKVEENL